MGNIFSFEIDSRLSKGFLIVGIGICAFGGYKYWQSI